MKHLTQKILSKRQTKVPNYGMTAFGYTKRSGAPTSWMIKLEGEARERRLMIIQFSNVESLFVRMKSEDYFLHEYDLPYENNH